MYDIWSPPEKYKANTLKYLSTPTPIKDMGYPPGQFGWVDDQGGLDGGPCDSSDSPSPLVLGFGDFGLGDRACQFFNKPKRYQNYFG